MRVVRDEPRQCCETSRSARIIDVLAVSPQTPMVNDLMRISNLTTHGLEAWWLHKRCSSEQGRPDVCSKRSRPLPPLPPLVGRGRSFGHVEQSELEVVCRQDRAPESSGSTTHVWPTLVGPVGRCALCNGSSKRLQQTVGPCTLQAFAANGQLPPLPFPVAAMLQVGRKTEPAVA
jgi:hypothetical protein